MGTRGLSLNRMLCNLTSWEKDAIERRADELLGLTKTIWPRPVPPSPTMIRNPTVVATNLTA